MYVSTCHGIEGEGGAHGPGCETEIGEGLRRCGVGGGEGKVVSGELFLVPSAGVSGRFGEEAARAVLMFLVGVARASGASGTSINQSTKSYERASRRDAYHCCPHRILLW